MKQVFSRIFSGLKLGEPFTLSWKAWSFGPGFFTFDGLAKSQILMAK